MSRPKRSLFHPMDLVFPIGTGVVLGALGVWSGIVAEAVGAKIASFGMTAVFLGAIPFLYIWRANLRRADFNAWGVLVRLGDKHRPDRQDVATWVRETVDAWVSKGYSETAVLAALDGVLLVYADAVKLGGPGRWMAGYNTGQTAVIGNRGASRSLTIHELSHSVLMGVEPDMRWEDHHAYFAQKGLGH